MKHSWAFWFNGRDANIKEVIGGRVFHSYVPDDRMLSVWMRRNDLWLRGFFRRWHYYRDRIPQPNEYRYPEKLAYTIPALLKSGHRRKRYRLDDINDPIGLKENPLAGENNLNAENLGWKSKQKHSDFISQPFYSVYKWYYDFFIDRGFLGENQ